MNKKGILNKIKELFAVEMFQGDYATEDGKIIRCYGEGLEVGTKVKEITEEGEVDIEDGDYVLKDGLVISVVKGVVTEIEEATSMEDELTDVDEVQTETDEEMTATKNKMGKKEKMEYLDTTLQDGTKVRVIGGELEVGAKVEVEKDGSYVKAPEGQHNLTDGRVIYVDAEGLINEIETPDTKKNAEEKLKEMYDAFGKLVEEMKKLKMEVSKIKKENTELKNNFNAFSKAPSVEPTKHQPKFSTLERDEKIKFFAR